MVKVRVELQAYLQQYTPDAAPALDFDVPEGASARDLVRGLAIPEEVVAVVITSNRVVPSFQQLSEGDEVTLVPPLAGG